MGSTGAAGTAWNLPNYYGELFLIGQNRTPFLNMIGGLAGGQIFSTASMEFALNQNWSLDSGSQPTITETESLTAPTATSYARAQDKNTCQIFHKQVSVSYVKQSQGGSITGDGTTYLSNADQSNPVMNEKNFQIMANMRQLSFDIDYTLLNGTYAQSTSASVAHGTRGVITACSTNAVAAGSATLSKSLLDQLFRTMWGNGALFMNTVIFCAAFQKQKISEIYGYAPQSRNVGGVNISQIETDFGNIGIVLAPNVPAATVAVVEMSVCRPVVCPVPDKGVLFYEELARTGASEKGQIYGQIGIDYGFEETHGKITGLSTS